MTKLSDARRLVDKLEDERAALEAKIQATRAEADQLTAERDELERRAWGAEEEVAVSQLEKLETRLQRNASILRGLNAQRHKVLEDLAAAQQERRRVEGGVALIHAQNLSASIASLQQQIDALVAERAAILNERSEAPVRDAREEREEAAAVASAREAVEALVTAARS